ncbi:MAG: hypothetical protein A2X28_02800 [Elusimicrobia bacterium GWA2_56_46]|nr:MAG: hypothetical protein A2X28_02800 [Elusimicrobia bacterium GWA2_56_46]OGR55313.1 MAG: hypothetical protein A2X39_00165 [Elusimicrobia bacterium GWC2_56_31]HBW22533.1 hypothetical protein [Elusimicrobiota bacterium]
MANVQKQFEEFHNKIRVDDYDSLREKRDIVLKRLRKHLKENKRPGFDELLQGSYAMGVGITPIKELEYDMDIGLRFEINYQDYNAAEISKWVYEGVEDHTDKVEQKGPCIRVTYAQGGYHLDLVCYAWEKNSNSGIFKLAHKTKGWKPADPPGLLEFVEKTRKPFDIAKDSATQTDQFRRSVRYLKRWNDEAIPRESDTKPTGLSFILLCAEHLSPTVAASGQSDDLTALRNFALLMANTTGRLVAKKPTPEYEDILAKLPDAEMNALKSRFESLVKILGNAAKETDPIKACELLQTVFGKDFPVPTAEETAARTSAPAIITSSSSA